MKKVQFSADKYKVLLQCYLSQYKWDGNDWQSIF